MSAMLALVLVLSGMLMPCPACEQAEARQLPPDAHACCTKGIPADSTAAQASPGSTDPSDNEPSRQDCLRFALSHALASLKAEQVAPSIDARLMDVSTPNAAPVVDSDWVTVTGASSWLAGLHGPPDTFAHGPAPGAAPTPLRL